MIARHSIMVRRVCDMWPSKVAFVRITMRTRSSCPAAASSSSAAFRLAIGTPPYIEYCGRAKASM